MRRRLYTARTTIGLAVSLLLTGCGGALTRPEYERQRKKVLEQP